MSRRRSQTRISLFSFQDIIMSVVGIVILITLLLILKLISQTIAAEPIETPEFTEAELNRRIESLEQSRREIQDEIAIARRNRDAAVPNVPSAERVDGLRTSVERLDADLEGIKADIEAAKARHDELLRRPDLKIAEETEKRLAELERIEAEQRRKNRSVEESAKNLREKLEELKRRRAGLERKLSEEVAKKIYVTPHKSTDKNPFILIYGTGAIAVISAADSSRKTFASENEFLDWAGSRDRKTEYFVLYVRPSRFEQYENLLDRLKSRGFDAGLQVIGEQSDISFQ